MAALGLCCCVRAFSSCVEGVSFLVAVHGLLIVVASLVAEHRLWGVPASVIAAHRLAQWLWRAGLSSCGPWA